MNREEDILKALEQMASEAPIAEGHEDRFEQRLREGKKAKVITFNFRVTALVGAAAAVVIAIGVYFFVLKDPGGERLAKVDYPQEVKKAKEYFQANNVLDTKTLEYKDEKVTEFLTKLQELENEYHRLDTLYQMNVQNENIIRGMMENFQYRLQIIHQLKSYIELKNQSNNNTNESSAT
ncbi:MAG: hypothetical protein ACK4WD_10555 [Flavobacteriales bacterium]|jgi:hypothetical protein